MSKKMKELAGGLRKKLAKSPAGVIRVLFQIAFFFLSPGLFASAFGGVKSIAAAMGSGEALALSAHVTALILLLSFTLLFGRVFCGYACSFGALGDAVYFLAGALLRRLGIKRFRKKPPRQLRFVKYGVLLLLIILSAMGKQQFIHGVSPWNAFAQIVGGNIPPDSEYLVGCILLGVILIGMASTPRFFCRFLCPMGALFSILPPALFVRLRKPKDASEKNKACGKCRLCSNQCPADLELAQQDAVTSGECFSCCRCVDACYQKKPKLSMFGLVSGTHDKMVVLGLILMGLVMLMDM